MRAATDGTTGVFNAAGDPVAFESALDLAAAVAGFTGERVVADPEWLLGRDVQHWMGPRSLPLWLPDDALGLTQTSVARARAEGFTPRPLEETLQATLADERERGLGRDRRAGLSRSDELALLADPSLPAR